MMLSTTRLRNVAIGGVALRGLFSVSQLSGRYELDARKKLALPQTPHTFS